MKLKPGAKLAGMRPELMFGIMVARDVYGDRPFVITEVTGGKHGVGSRHFIGLAADLRARAPEFTADEAVLIRDDIAERLGDQFDVILERRRDGTVSHIHLEMDPK